MGEMILLHSDKKSVFGNPKGVKFREIKIILLHNDINVSSGNPQGL